MMYPKRIAVQEVRECYLCPHWWCDAEKGLQFCKVMGNKEIPSTDDLFPEWCPLEEVLGHGKANF